MCDNPSRAGPRPCSFLSQPLWCAKTGSLCPFPIQLLHPLIITFTFTSYQFSLHLQKHRTYIYLLSLLHTLTIYINAYITSAEFVLTGFCLPFDLGPVSMWRIDWSGLNPQGLRSFWSKTSLQDHVGITNFCRVLLSWVMRRDILFWFNQVFIKMQWKVTA